MQQSKSPLANKIRVCDIPRSTQQQDWSCDSTSSSITTAQCNTYLKLECWHLLWPLPVRVHCNETNSVFTDIFPYGWLKRIWQVFMTSPTTLTTEVKSSVVKISDSAIKGLVLSGQTLNPTLPWLEVNPQSGMGTSKTDHLRFRVPGSMQIVGPTLSGKTTCLSKLIQDAVTYFLEMTLETLYVFFKACTVAAPPGNLCCLSPRNTNHPLGRSVSPGTTP